MSADLLPGSILSMSAQAADRLLKLDSGDAALLYIYLLGHPDHQGLKWPALRLQTAMDQLVAQGLAKPLTAPVVPDPAPAPPPEYSREDVVSALESEKEFSALCDEVERRLGKKLIPSDLTQLLTIYDHMSLPAEVILMLVAWCIEEYQTKYKVERPPSVSYIRKEAARWERRGIDTMEAAEAHIQKMTSLRSREKEILRILDIPARPLVERERNYVAVWDEMGFDNEALRMAYERTIMKKQSMDWSYMNGILRRWHEKGLHTAAAIQTGDHDPRPIRANAPAPQPSQAQEEQRTREDMERMRRMLEQMREEE